MKKLLFTIALLAAGAIAGLQAQVSLDQPVTLLTLQSLGGSLPNGIDITRATYKSGPVTTTGAWYSIDTGIVYQPSSNAAATNFTLTATFQNSLGAPITELTFSYDAFVSVMRTARTPAWKVTSSLGDVSVLDWSSTEPNATRTVTLTDLNILPDETFTFTFESDRGAGSQSSPAIGLANFEITATAVPEPSTLALLAVAIGFGAWRMRTRASKA